MTTPSWQSRVVDALCDLKREGYTFEAAWTVSDEWAADLLIEPEGSDG